MALLRPVFQTQYRQYYVKLLQSWSIASIVNHKQVISLTYLK